MHVINKEEFFEPGVDDEMDRFAKISKLEIDRIISGENTTFRNYAATNSSEFFAVAVEHFFETPCELQTSYPIIYSSLDRLLKQDPAKLTYGN